jgi:hypothetical protein
MKKKTKQNINNNSASLLDTPSVPSLLTSSACSVPSLPEPPVPVKFYPNSDTCKKKILSDNQNKSGIYMWKNSKNGKCYIGSAVDLPNRLSFYFSLKAMENLLKRSKSHICSALLKYGHDNFSLTILEYCERDQLLIREKHYWGIFNPEYNIAKEPGAPMSGRTHSDAPFFGRYSF